jgi:PTH1 family peptidyl-tRNA hydrolase
VKTIVGLGNPGQTYRDTRHNVGYEVLQALAAHRGITMEERMPGLDGRLAAVFGEGQIGQEPVRLVMPLTMMNASGETLKAMALTAQGLSELLVVCDDVHLPVGTIRLRPQGSAGGHQGLVSCLEAVGTEAVVRLRIGVGTVSLPSDLEEFVLSPFRPEERPRVAQAIERAVGACEVWATGGLEQAMNQYNRAPAA